MTYNEQRSISYCNKNFSHYANFATLRLYTAVICHDQYDLDSFDSAFHSSGKDHEHNSSMQNFMANLDYPDAEYFSTDELRFYLQVGELYKTLTDEQIELERHQIIRDGESGLILKSHVEYLLKAVQYWKMHFNRKIDQWRKDFVEANRKWILRRKLAAGDITEREAQTGIIVEDDGYFSGDDWYFNVDDSDSDEWMSFGIE